MYSDGMKKILIVIALTALAVSVSLMATNIAFARALPAIGNVEKNMFKNLVKAYLHPAVNGWSIGLNTATDSYLIAKFHVVTVKTLPRAQIVQIIREAKAGNATTWAEVRDSIRAAIEANSTSVTKGRIQINKVTYVLTDVARTETTFAANIRNRPDYSGCVAANISAEQCEQQSASVGDLSLTRKAAELEDSKQRVWAGTMNFNNTAYTFVALVNPRLSD